jgi:hypothetical protein
VSPFETPVKRLRPLEWALILLLWFVAIGALYGGAQLVIAPDGSRMNMRLAWLVETPFMDYFVPGLILMVIVGGGHALIGWGVLRHWTHASLLAGAAGASLVIWIVVQMLMLHTHNGLQLTYLAFGLIECALAAAVKLLKSSRAFR